MTLTLITSGIKQQKVQIQITSPHDPLILYMLDISEVEFHQIKKEQSLLIDFQNFPSFLMQMLELCNEDESKKFTCILHKTSLYEALLVVQERTDFRELNHLILRVNQANDTIVKKFLGSMTMEFKTKYNNILNDLNNLNINYKKLSEENNQLKEEIDKNEFEQKKNIDNLIIEKDIEINNIKEQSFQESKDKIYEGIYPHNINIEERLKIIFYFFKKKVNNYELNVKGKKHIETIYQKIKTKKYKEEQKKFYEILTRNINDIDDMILEDFFKDILQNKEQFNLKEVNNNESIKLIIQTFQKVNENKKALIYDGRNIRIEGGAQIEGLIYFLIY